MCSDSKNANKIEMKNPNYGYLADTENFADFRVTFESNNLNKDGYLVINRQTKQ